MEGEERRVVIGMEVCDPSVSLKLCGRRIPRRLVSIALRRSASQYVSGAATHAPRRSQSNALCIMMAYMASS